MKFTGVEGYLRAVELMRRPYLGNIESFVLKHGSRFTEIGTLPPFVKRGRLKMCFMNAYRAATNDSSLTYVEGFAGSIIPVLHAWCLDSQGRVIEVTWPDDFGDAEYFGVPFTTKFLMQSVFASRTYGLLDSPNNRPLLLGELNPQQWQRTIKPETANERQT